MYSQARSLPTAGYIEAGEYSAVAFMPPAEGLVVGQPPRGRIQGREGGRGHGAAQGSGAVRRRRPGREAPWRSRRNPVAVLNERAQPASSPCCTPPRASRRRTGRCLPARLPAPMRRDAIPVAEGRNKNEAKAAAAAGLLDQVAAQERSAVAQLARRRRRRHAARGASRLLCGSAARWTSTRTYSGSAIPPVPSSPGRWRAGRAADGGTARPGRTRRRRNRCTRRHGPGLRPPGPPLRRSPRGVSIRRWTPTAVTAGGWRRTSP